METLAIVGQTLLAVFGVLGIGAIVRAFLDRHWKLKDAKVADNSINHASDLDASSEFRDALIKRIETLEKRLDDVNSVLTSQMKENARLAFENESLKAENVRLEGEIEELRADAKEAECTIQGLRQELDALKARFDKL